MPIRPDIRKGKPTSRWVVEVQKDGQRFRKRYDTHAEAVTAEQAFLQGEGNGVKRVEYAMTLGALVRKAEGTLWRGKLAERESYLTLHKAIRLIGPKTRLDAINTDLIDDLDRKLATKAPATRNRHHACLRKLLKWGKERGDFPYPLPTFTREREDNGRIRWLSPEEEDGVVGLLEGYGQRRMADLVVVAIKTGMRLSELLSLSKGQVEPKWVRLWKTKINKARSVPISPETFSLLTTLVGFGMPSEQEVRYWWTKIRNEMGMSEDPGFVFHCCRHTCATRMVQSGVDIRVIQKFMGHEAIVTTMRYAHVCDASLESALNQTANTFSRVQQSDLGYSGLMVRASDATNSPPKHGGMELVPLDKNDRKLP